MDLPSFKARYATAGDSEKGRLLVKDGKSEGVWPLEKIPKNFCPLDFLPDKGIVIGYYSLIND
jgi:hypothetical protein